MYDTNVTHLNPTPSPMDQSMFRPSPLRLVLSVLQKVRYVADMVTMLLKL